MSMKTQKPVSLDRVEKLADEIEDVHQGTRGENDV